MATMTTARTRRAPKAAVPTIRANCSVLLPDSKGESWKATRDHGTWLVGLAKGKGGGGAEAGGYCIKQNQCVPLELGGGLRRYYG